MKIVETIKEFILEINNEKQIVIYGAGEIGKLIFKFLIGKGISVTAFTVTVLNTEWKCEGIPVRALDDIISGYQEIDLIIILAVTKMHQPFMEEELKKRKISSYIKLSDVLLYELEIEKQKSDAREFESKKRALVGKTVGYLTPGYLNTNYAEERLIINKMKDVSYVAIPKETARMMYTENEYDENLEDYKQIVEACYCPEEYIPEVDLIHTFNMVCDTEKLWCASFETAMPRVWPKTDVEKDYFLQLIEYMKRPNCSGLFALSKNAYNIQRQHLLSYVSSVDVNVLMKKTKIIHPPQKILISENEFEKKHSKKEIRFIFIGASFFIKGGREIVKALSKFEGKYEFELTLISSMLYNDYFTKTSYAEMIKWKSVVQEKKWIDYYEQLPNKEVLEKCKEATIGLLPSVADTYGYSVLEMQAAGCPVVTTNVRAFPEINNKKCGWVCQIPVDDLGVCTECDKLLLSEILENELEKCFQDIFEHPEMIEKKGRAALERIKEMHDPDNYQKELKKNLE